MGLSFLANDAAEAAKILCFEAGRVGSFTRAMGIALAAIAAQWVIVLLAGESRPSHLADRLHRFSVNLLVAAVSIQIAYYAVGLSIAEWYWTGTPRTEDALGLFNFTLLISLLAVAGIVSHSPRNFLRSRAKFGTLNHDSPPALGSADLPWRLPIISGLSGWGSLVAAALL